MQYRIKDLLIATTLIAIVLAEARWIFAAYAEASLLIYAALLSVALMMFPIVVRNEGPKVAAGIILVSAVLCLPLGVILYLLAS